MSPLNTAEWNDVVLRWGSASSDDDAGLIAGFPVFLLADPDLDRALAREASWTMLDAFEALRDAHPEGPSIEAIQDVWRECVRIIQRRLAEATIFGMDETVGDAVPSVRLAGLVATMRGGEPLWVVMSSGGARIMDASDGQFHVVPEQDDVGYDLPGKLWTFPMRAGQRLVLATSTMLRLTSHGRMLSALSHLRRAERAATTLVTQQGQMAAQAAIVVDILSPEQAEQRVSPPTLLADIEEPSLEDTATGSGVLTGGWGLEALGFGSPTSASRRSHTPPPELDDFHFVSYLGSGGFSDVYVYEEQLPKRLVAIKVLSKNALGGGDASRFRGEVDLMAQLSGHPSVVPIHDADIASSGQPYVVMEYCPLPSLAERIAARDLSLADALRMGIQIAGAVHTAHIMSIVHYDIKPANVLYSAFGRPLLGDFGIASLAGAAEHEVMGASLPWAAPEVLTNSLAGAPADVYSLAATVYTACTGKAPFAKRGKKTRVDYIREVLRGRYLPVAMPEVSADVVVALNDVLREAMAVDATARMQTAAEFGRALQGVQTMLGGGYTELEIPPGG